MTPKSGRYHHGDLRAALVDVAIELIAERGVQGFSLAEASRRLGVTVAAPYKHFADRDELLAAVAVKASEHLAAAVTVEAAATNGPDRLAAAAAGYVRCAAAHRPLFQVLFEAGLDKSRYPEIDAAAQPIAEAFLIPARTIRADPADAHELTRAVVAAAHGHAALLLDGAFGRGPEALDAATRRTTTVTRAIVAGWR